MSKSLAKNDIYAQRGSSAAQRGALTIAVGGSAAVSWWLLFGGGIASTGARLGQRWDPGDDTRRIILTAALSIYFLRLLLTQFVFQKRALSWREAGMIAPWILCIYLVLSIAEGTNSDRAGVTCIGGVVLFVWGSWMNSYAEYARYAWKRRHENHERLFTLGLFRYSRHPNYLGDLISFSGLCLISGRWIATLIPVIMTTGFIFVNIPMLDSHLRDHYGPVFDEYAARTSKLIPFVY